MFLIMYIFGGRKHLLVLFLEDGGSRMKGTGIILATVIACSPCSVREVRICWGIRCRDERFVRL